VPYDANRQEEEEEEEEAAEGQEEYHRPHLMLTCRNNPLNKPKM